jgi:hypothetical protein
LIGDYGFSNRLDNQLPDAARDGFLDLKTTLSGAGEAHSGGSPSCAQSKPHFSNGRNVEVVNPPVQPTQKAWIWVALHCVAE